MILYNFSLENESNEWLIINDDVMGGVSQGKLEITDQGQGCFHGHISLANNGGFSLMKLQLISKDVSNYSKIELRLKGDRKRYQFRLKSKMNQKHSFVHYFETDGQWQRILLNFSDFYATYKGRKLDIPGYPGKEIEEIAFLIGNGTEQYFQLLVDSVVLLP